MLFISRYVMVGNERHYGVVDTDDDTEQIVSLSDLHDCRHYGIDIKGARYIIHNDSGTIRYELSHLRVYNSHTTVNKQMAKLKTLAGVDIVLYRHMITQITWDIGKFTRDIVIRLSDFGTFCADWIFYGLATVIPDPKYTITFILDDNVEFSTSSFMMIPHVEYEEYVMAGVRFDVRELSDENAKTFYTCMLREINDFSVAKLNKDRKKPLERLSSLVTDRELRKSVMLY